MTTITSKTRLSEAEVAGLGAARTLQRRLRARQLYRIRRDRKIAVDWLGREFDWEWHGLVRITSYNPDNHSIGFEYATGQRGDVFRWNTDTFWYRLRTGRLLLL